jgi:type IV pilus assembly protein PilA
MRNRKGFTLIELMIVVAIIGILAAIAIPMYRTQTVKAKISEATRAVNTVATAIGDYVNDEDRWPGPMTTAQMYTSLGVGVVLTSDDAEAKLSSIAVGTSGLITATLANCGSDVNGLTVVLDPTRYWGTTNAISWDWDSSTVPEKYIPKK